MHIFIFDISTYKYNTILNPLYYNALPTGAARWPQLSVKGFQHTSAGKGSYLIGSIRLYPVSQKFK